MTVSAQNSYISYTGNGSTTAYSWPYKLFAAGDLKVYTVVIATGVETLQTSGGAGTYDYTISVAGDYSGATVTLNNNLPATHKVFLTRVQALEQATDYIEGDAFPAETHEQTLDKIVLQLQQHEEQLKRSLKFKQSTATRSEPSVPELTADTLIKVNSAGTGFETQSTVDVSTIAGIAADVTTVSGIAADVTAVAADATDIGTVATNIASVNTVATNINDVITVANDLNEAVSEVETVADDLNEAVSEIDTVANNIADVQTVGNATNIANISTVAGQISPTNNVSTLAGIAPDITTLAGTSGLTTLAASAGDISTLAGIQADITAVAAIDAAVSAVNSNAANINAVNANSANINAVNANSTNINTVATDLAGSDTIGTVATNIGQVQNFAQAYRISATAPTTSLDVGDLWFDTTNNVMKVYSSGGWITAASAINGTADRFTFTVSSSTTTITGPDDSGNTLAYDAGYLDVYLNGVKMVNGTDVTVTSGTSIVFASPIGASGTDVVDVVAFGTFELANFSIGDANDVSVTGVTNGQALTYNSTSGNFEPTTLITDVVGDTTPQLGGNLDLNSNDITGTGNINITGSVTATSFVGVNSNTDWQSVKTANFTAISGEGYFVDTTSGAITVTLPASPSIGDFVTIKDYAKTFDTNNCTIGRNGSKIGGDEIDSVLTTEGISVTLVFTDSTQGWLVTSSGLTSETPTSKSVIFKLWGAGGGSASGGTDGGPGGGGGFVIGTYDLPIGTTVYAVVGQGGPGGSSGYGGSGGGYSGVFTTSVAHGNALLIAGGGAGGSRGTGTYGSYGGAGGGLTGGSGQASSGTAPTGGTQVAGGTAGSNGSGGNAGTALTGGSNTSNTSGGTAFGGGGDGGGDAASFTAGGGGGGYYGGGSGGDAGGGGGSSYLGTATSTTNTQGNITAGSGAGGLTANSSDAQYPGNVGDGGAWTGGAGSNPGENGAIAYQIDGGSWVALSYTGSTQTFTVT